MLDLMAGKECEVITGVTIGESYQDCSLIVSLSMCRCPRLQIRVNVMLDTVSLL